MKPTDLLRLLDGDLRRLSSAAEVKVLLALVARTNRAGFAWPSVERLAADCGLTARSVQRALQQLAWRGLIERVGPRPVKVPPGVIRFVNMWRVHLSAPPDKRVTRTRPLRVTARTPSGDNPVAQAPHDSRVGGSPGGAVALSGTRTALQPLDGAAAATKSGTSTGDNAGTKGTEELKCSELGKNTEQSHAILSRTLSGASPPPLGTPLREQRQEQEHPPPPVVWQHVRKPKVPRPCSRCGGRRFWFPDVGSAKRCAHCRPPKQAGDVDAWLVQVRRRRRWLLFEVYKRGHQEMRSADGYRVRVHRARRRWTVTSSREQVRATIQRFLAGR